MFKVVELYAFPCFGSEQPNRIGSIVGTGEGDGLIIVGPVEMSNASGRQLC